MDFDYNEYERACEVIRNENEKYLKVFETALAESGLAKRTIDSHYENVRFFINEFLLREMPRPMTDGWLCVEDFFGYFFIRKCMWSTPGTIKSTAASIKKFYKCMLEHGELEESYYKILCDTIKENMTTWQAYCQQYNDPHAPDPLDEIDIW